MAIKNATATLEADMTGSAVAYGLVKATATLEADMTGTIAGDSHQTHLSLTMEADMTGTASGDSHQTHLTANLSTSMTGTATAHAFVSEPVTLSGSRTMSVALTLTINSLITMVNGGQQFTTTGQPNATAKLEVQPTVTLSGSRTFSVSSIVPGQATLSGSRTMMATPHVESAAPAVTLSGSRSFAANPVGTISNSMYKLSLAYAYIGGVIVPIEAGTLQIKGILAQRATAQFTVTDNLAQWNFIQGMPVIVRDAYGNRQFSGFVTQSVMTKPTNAGPTIQHDIHASDIRYATDKRVVATSYSNQTAGYIVTDLINNQIPGEGIFLCTGKNILTDALSTALSNTIPPGMSTVSASVVRADPLQLWTGQDVWQWTPNGATTFEELLILLADSHFSDNTQYTCSFYARCLFGTPQIRFEGYESSPSTGFSAATGTLSSSWQRFTVTWTTPNPIPNRGSNSLGLRIDTGSNTYSIPIQIAGVQIEAGASATAWEFGGTVTVQAGPTIVAMTINYKYVSDQIDELVQTAGFQWYVDQWNRMWFETPGTQAAPFNPVSHTHMNAGTVSVTNTSPLYRNAQYITGINATTSAQTETQNGDGQTRAFTFAFPLNQKPSAFTVNGVTKTLGTKGTSGKDFYWAKGDPVIAQDSGAAVLLNTDTISMTYIGEYPSVILSTDPAAQALRAATEVFTTGIVEEVETNSKINSTAEGFQVAAGFLQRYTPQGQQIVFDTYYGGLSQGQNALVSIPEMNIVSQSMLIEEVDITDGDPELIYTVTAIIGPFDTNWVSFFRKLAKPPNYVDAIGGNENGSLTIAESITGAYPAPTGTLTITVSSVPFPHTTLYPSSSLYPG